MNDLTLAPHKSDTQSGEPVGQTASGRLILPLPHVLWSSAAAKLTASVGSKLGVACQRDLNTGRTHLKKNAEFSSNECFCIIFLFKAFYYF